MWTIFFYFKKLKLIQWIMLILGIPNFWFNSLGIRFWHFVIWTPVIFSFWSVFIRNPFSSVVLCDENVSKEFYCASFGLCEKFAWECPLKKLIFEVQFPGNWFEFGFIGNQFWSSTIWAINLSSTIWAIIWATIWAINLSYY